MNENEDKLRGMVEGVAALQSVRDVARERGIDVPNVRALLDRTLEDIDALCGEQLAGRS
jgi:glycerol-3-phosphate dehydrogenase